MKSSIFRIVMLGAICASFMGVIATASAQHQGMRELRAEMARLQDAKGRAIASHHWAQAHQMQRMIDRLRVRMNNHG